MYDTRFPRPGPAMVAMAALIGLITGGVLAFSGSGGSHAIRTAADQTTASSTPGPTSRASAGTSVTVPSGTFWTVVLLSPSSQDKADAAAAAFKREGVDDAVVIRRADVANLGTRYAIVSGRFDSRTAALAHLRELQLKGVDGYPKRLVVS